MTATGGRLTVFFDGDCGVCAWSASAIDRLDWRGRIRLVPYQARAAQEAGSPTNAALARTLHVVDHSGRWERGGAACLRIASAIPLLRPVALLGNVPGVPALVERAYRLVARNRHRLGHALGMASCTYAYRAQPSGPSGSGPVDGRP